MKIKKICYFSCLFFSLLSLNAFSQVKTLKFCGDEADSWPWMLPKSTGLLQGYIDNIEKTLKVKVTLERQPWIRCLKEMEKGNYDGVVNGSFKEDRLVYGVYPTTPDGKVDPSKSLTTSSYYFYSLKSNQNLKWDGNTLTGMRKPIMITLGYSIKKKLVDELKVPLIEKNMALTKQFELMIAGDVDAVAGQEPRIDYILKNNQFFASKIKKLNPALESKPYYFILSHQLVKLHPQFAKDLWNSVESLRESEDFKAKIEAFVNQEE